MKTDTFAEIRQQWPSPKKYPHRARFERSLPPALSQSAPAPGLDGRPASRNFAGHHDGSTTFFTIRSTTSAPSKVRRTARSSSSPPTIPAFPILHTATIGKTPYGWPWPRQFWGMMIDYCNRCGAKAVAIDIVFSEPSVYNDVNGDDTAFAGFINKSKIPVVFGSLVSPDAKPGNFAPPVKKPAFGAVNVNNDVVFRQYSPIVNAFPSLASATVSAVGRTPFSQPFLLHYYGPTSNRANNRTFRYLPASHVLGASITSKTKDFGIKPEMFKDKIVVIGAITVGTYDLKSSPLSAEYPGVEIQATAIANMLENRQVHVVPGRQRIWA